MKKESITIQIKKSKMAEPELRRASDPKFVRKIYFGIKKTCEQKQCPTLERIIRALSIDKSQISRSRVEIQLNNAVRDGIIIESNSQGNRGKSVGEMKNSYRIPTLDNFYENYEDDGHDWYCWVCHREGEVYLCSRCPRVIHKKCAELTSEDLTDDFVCYCCKDLESTKQYGKKELQELSTMLSFTVDRMKSKCEELWTSPDEEKEPNYKLFIYKDTNLNDLEKKVKNKEFDSLAKFHYEIEWLFHNAVIFYGVQWVIHASYLKSNLIIWESFNGGCEQLQKFVSKYCLNATVVPKNVCTLLTSALGNGRVTLNVVSSYTYEKGKGPGTEVDKCASLVLLPTHPLVCISSCPELSGEHKITQLARIVVLDGQSELSQIDICSECYINSNKRPKNWFSKPCKPPHTIVYAKLGSDPPWPAKVLRENETNTSLDVRFFGAPYQRAWIPLKNIWELNNKPPTKKRSKALVQAEEELKIYLRILNAMGDEQDEKPLRSSTSVESDVSSDNDDDDDDSDFDAKGKDSDEEKPKKKRAKFGKVENKAINKRKVGRPRKNEIVEPKKNPRKLKAEERFRQLQESKLKALQKSSAVSHTLVDIKKPDINKNIGKLSSSLSPDSEFAQQIKMTDDYKMIEKLQHQVRNLEKQLEKMKTDYENSQADLEATRLELAAEKQKSKRLQEENDTSNKGHEEDLEKVKNDLLSKKKDDLDSAIEEERQRSELEFKSRLEEAKNEERSKGEVRLQEELEKERAQFEAKVKMKVQHEKDEMQRNFERYKAELEVKHARTLEEENRKKKLEADELYKRTVQRIHLDTERMVAAAKKKSWCSNCNKEAFYHCCWNTNYCSTECQRVHWVAHRYNCTREMMSSTCRSCQQRQNFPPTNFPPQVPPK